MQNFGVTNKEYYGMLLYFLEWSIQCRIQTLRKGGGAVSEKFFSTVGHRYGLKMRGALPLDPPLQ